MNTETGPLAIGGVFLEKYQIAAALGHGGQAWVYRATHVVDGREVAVKVIHSPFGMSHEMLNRGQAEARALGKLDHPNVVRMLDSGLTHEGIFYIIMELLRGRSWRAMLIERPRLEIEEVLTLAIQAGEGIQHAHEHNMIHRDLKPENMFLLQGNRLKVLDFGVAKLLDEIGFTTKKNVVLGSLLYMSPEQTQGLSLTPRSDICALGLIIFESLIGKHPTHLVFEQDLRARREPYRKPTLADIPQIQVSRIYPMLSDLDPSIPLYLAMAVQRAVAKVAEQRFASMADFVRVLRECLEKYRAEGRPARGKSRDLSVPPASKPDSGTSAKPASVNVTEQLGPLRVRSKQSEKQSRPDAGMETALLGTTHGSESAPAPTPEKDVRRHSLPRELEQSRLPAPSYPENDGQREATRRDIPVPRHPPTPTPAAQHRARALEVAVTQDRALAAPTPTPATPSNPRFPVTAAPDDNDVPRGASWKQGTAPPVSVKSRAPTDNVKQPRRATRLVLWIAIIGGCLFGTAAGTLGGLAYFPAAKAATSGEGVVVTAQAPSIAAAPQPSPIPTAPSPIIAPPQESAQTQVSPPEAAPATAVRVVARPRPATAPSRSIAPKPSDNPSPAKVEEGRPQEPKPPGSRTIY